MGDQLTEALERLHLIASGDRDCDMSENDLGALRVVLMTFDANQASISTLRSVLSHVIEIAEGAIHAANCDGGMYEKDTLNFARKALEA